MTEANRNHGRSMVIRFLLACLVAVIALTSCGGEDEADQANGRSECLPVAEKFRVDALRVSERLSAVRLPERQEVWAVASASGGVWVGNDDPTTPEPDGVTVPLNDKARALSDFGSAARPGTPVYPGSTDRVRATAVVGRK